MMCIQPVKHSPFSKSRTLRLLLWVGYCLTAGRGHGTISSVGTQGSGSGLEPRNSSTRVALTAVQAVGSGVERFVDTEEVTGSNPVPPIFLSLFRGIPFLS